MGTDWLPFGILGRPHGTNGELLLHPHNATAAGSPGMLLSSRVRLTGGDVTRELAARSARHVPEGYLVAFEGVADREAATALVGLELHVPRRGLAPLAAAEFYVEDVVGCEVADAAGRSCGHVRGTFWNGAQDVMVVVDEDGCEHLYPVVAEYVLSFDAERRRVIVDPHE
jgi:16S rRNA processing protein RimM